MKQVNWQKKIVNLSKRTFSFSLSFVFDELKLLQNIRNFFNLFQLIYNIALNRTEF